MIPYHGKRPEEEAEEVMWPAGIWVVLLAFGFVYAAAFTLGKLIEWLSSSALH